MGSESHSHAVASALQRHC